MRNFTEQEQSEIINQYISELAKVVYVQEIVCDTKGNFAELGIVLGGSQLYGKE